MAKKKFDLTKFLFRAFVVIVIVYGLAYIIYSIITLSGDDPEPETSPSSVETTLPQPSTSFALPEISESPTGSSKVDSQP